MKLIRWQWPSSLVSAQAAVRGCVAVLTGTVVAFVVSLVFPLFKPDQELLKGYIKQHLPLHTVAMAIAVGASLLLVAVLTVAVRIWRSMRLGLVRFPMSVWFVCVAAFWLLIESHHSRIALAFIFGAAALALLIKYLA